MFGGAEVVKGQIADGACNVEGEVASAVRWSVPKSAVLPGPSAMVPPLQLAALVQLPPLSLIQTPLAALVCGTCVVNKPTIEQENEV